MSLVDDIKSFLTKEVNAVKMDVDKLKLGFDAMKVKHDIKSLAGADRDAIDTALNYIQTGLGNLSSSLEAAVKKAESQQSSTDSSNS